MRAILLAVLLAFLAVPDLLAQAPLPEQITFQGRLTDAAGNPVTGDVQMVFSIYDAASGGVALWTETQSVAVTGGLYSAQLGTVSDFSGLTLDMTNGRWLGIQVVGEASEMTPRYPLTGAPYARRALGADNAGLLDGLDATAFARTLHFHNASAINAGTLPVSRGGTGLDEAGANGNILLCVDKYWVSTPGASTFIQNQSASAQGGSFWISGTAVIDLALSARGTVALGDALTDTITIGGTIQGAQPLVFEGGTQNDYELALAIATLTGDRTLTLPDVSGIVITTGNLGAITAVGTVLSGTWNGSVIAHDYGGTGLTSPGTAGSYLRSNGTAWTSTAIQAGDLPASGTPYLKKNAHDTSTAEYPGYLYEISNDSSSGYAGGLAARATALNASDGFFYGLIGTSAVNDNADNGTVVINFGVTGSADGEAEIDGGLVMNYGVRGVAYGSSAVGDTVNYGVSGLTSGVHASQNYGVHAMADGATSDLNCGVYGIALNGAINWAGYFQGNVHVAGALSKSAGTFKIDHPLDPENRYLSHSFVESPDMMNVYNGNVELDSKGEAVVTMPDWFEALNRDFRYQLTPVGGPAPDLHVAEKISGGRFRIAGGRPGLEVSWQVTGIRQDAFARMHPVVVEEEKPARDRGRYLAPEAYGLPPEMGIGYVRPPEAAKAPARADAKGH